MLKAFLLVMIGCIIFHTERQNLIIIVYNKPFSITLTLLHSERPKLYRVKIMLKFWQGVY